MTDSGVQPTFENTLREVVVQTRRILERDPESLGPIHESPGEFVSSLEQFASTSEVFGEVLASDLSPETELSEIGLRSRLYWAAAADLLALRCVGIVECLDALARVCSGDYGLSADEIQALLSSGRSMLFEELDLLDEDLNTRVIPGVLGLPEVNGAAMSATAALESLADDTVARIIQETVSNITDAAFGALSGLVPMASHGFLGRMIRKALKRIGVSVVLEELVELGDRVLTGAQAKLGKVFSPGLNVAIDKVKALLGSDVKALLGSDVRDRVGERLFEESTLLEQCHARIAQMDAPQIETSPSELLSIGSSNLPELHIVKKDPLRLQIAIQAATDNLVAVAKRFDRWDKGIDVAAYSLKWGSRIAVLTPPAAATLASISLALAGGSACVGQYYLDWPDWQFILWKTNGVLRALSA